MNLMKEILESCSYYNKQSGSRFFEYEKAECKIKKLVLGCVPKSKIQFLSKSRLNYELGWCEGRNQLRNEIHKNIKKLFAGG